MTNLYFKQNGSYRHLYTIQKMASDHPDPCTFQIKASGDPDLPVIHEIHQDETSTNIKHFHHVISHQEERE
jgi:hypothetical protein